VTLDKTLLQCFYSGKFTHSWLIGAGDEEKALEEVTVFAREILAASPLQIENNPNFYILRRQNNSTGELAKHITIDQVRKLQNFLSTKNAEERYKISVIYQADLMNVNAANCCLKLLEEPGHNNLIFLITQSPHKLLPTIRSRCSKLWASSNVAREDDKADELMSYVNDHKLFINKLSSKIDGEFVCALCRSAMEIVGMELKAFNNTHNHNPRDLLYKFEQINKIAHNLSTFDLDPKVSFIMLIEEMSH
jgi:DNA polymerase-3 subunit delta'